MQNDWILDILADLRRFAEMNGMPGLASHLDEAALLAATEISNQRPSGTRSFAPDPQPQSARARLNKSL